MGLTGPGKGSIEPSYNHGNERSLSTNCGEPESKWQGWRGSFTPRRACWRCELIRSISGSKRHAWKCRHLEWPKWRTAASTLFLLRNVRWKSGGSLLLWTYQYRGSLPSFVKFARLKVLARTSAIRAGQGRRVVAMFKIVIINIIIVMT